MKFNMLTPTQCSKTLLLGTFLFGLLFLETKSFANSSSNENSKQFCEILFEDSSPSFSSLQEQAEATTKMADESAPPPEFINLNEERNIQWTGRDGLQALQDLLPPGAKFVASEAPGHETQGVVKLAISGRSVPIVFPFEWRGQTSSTTVYATLPKNTDLAQKSKSPYLIGQDYEHVVFHIHGGGTPTASGVNAMSPTGSIGGFFSKYNIPVISPDMHGHARGDRSPITNFEDLLDWSLELVKKLVHPDVKVTLSGHSWGAMAALELHRLSHKPKFKRFYRIISLSPGIDTTLGGTSNAKPNFDQWFQKNFHLYKDKIAASDYDFLENLMVRGKVAPIPEWFTNITSLNFRTPPLSVEEQRQLTPVLVMVGESDGLVYVGREEEYDQLFKNLAYGSQYIKINKAKTFESENNDDLKETGHNIFDALASENQLLKLPEKYAQKRADQEVPLTYTKMLEFILGREQFLNWSRSERPQSVTAEDNLYKLLFAYSNNFLAREFLNLHTEYIVSPVLEELQKYKKRGAELIKFQKQIETLQKKEKSNSEKLWKQKESELAQSMGLDPQMRLARAQDQLKFQNLSPERKKDLETFLSAYEAVENTLQQSWIDPFQKQKQEIIDSTDYKTIEELKKATQAKHKDKDKRLQIIKATSDYSDLEKNSKQNYADQLSEATQNITRPKGFTSLRGVRSELKTNMSDEYRVALQNFVNTYQQQLHLFEKERAQEIEQQIEALEGWPEGVQTRHQLETEAQALTALESLTYNPGTSPKVDQILQQYTAIEKAIEDLHHKPQNTKINISELEHNLDRKLSSTALLAPQLHKTKVALLKMRHSIYLQLENIWSAPEEQLLVSSPKIVEAVKTKEQTLQNFTQAYEQLSQGQHDHLKELFNKGLFNRENLGSIPPEVQSLFTGFRETRSQYLSQVRRLKQVYISEILQNQATGDAVQTLRPLLIKLFGNENYAQDQILHPNSIEGQIQTLTEMISSYQKRKTELNHKQHLIQMAYIKALNQLDGYKSPKKITAISIKGLLHQPLEKLIEQIQDPQQGPLISKVLQYTFSKWEDLWNMHIQEYHMKNQNPFL